MRRHCGKGEVQSLCGHPCVVAQVESFQAVVAYLVVHVEELYFGVLGAHVGKVNLACQVKAGYVSAVYGDVSQHFYFANVEFLYCRVAHIDVLQGGVVLKRQLCEPRVVNRQRAQPWVFDEVQAFHHSVRHVQLFEFGASRYIYFGYAGVPAEVKVVELRVVVAYGYVHHVAVLYAQVV